MYTTPEILIGKYGVDLLIRLTVKEFDGTETQPDMAVINREVARVDGTINGYLRGRYTIPLSEIPPELAGAADDMVIDRLYRCMPERTVPEDVTRAAKEAVAWLRDVQKGLATLSIETLPPASTGEPGTTGFFKTNKTTADRIFSDSVLDRFTGR